VTKHALTNAAKIGFGLGLFAWVIWKHWYPSDSGGPGLGEAFSRPIQWLPLCLAGVLCATALVTTFIRWYFLVRAQDLPFTLANAFRLGLVGYFYNTCTLGSIGGDLFKAYFIAKEQNRRTVAVATVLLDRALGLWGLIWLVSIAGGIFLWLGEPALIENVRLRWYVYAVGAVALATLAVWVLMAALPQRRADRFAQRLAGIPKVGHSAAEFWRAVWLYRCKGGSVAMAVFLAIVNHSCLVFAFWFAAHVFTQPGSETPIPSVAQHFLAVPLGNAIQTLPLSPGGVGVGEYVFGKLYELIGFPESTGVLAALALRLIMLALAFISFLVYLKMKPSLPATMPTDEGATDQEAIRARACEVSESPAQAISS
jgi:uncharacterized protein (TIRG00374 family)